MESESVNLDINCGKSEQSEQSERLEGGGIYLVVADESEEFDIALKYAAKTAFNNHGRLAVLYVSNVDDFQHWGNIEKIMRDDLRAKSEKYIWKVAKTANEINGIIPILYIREGQTNEAVIDILNNENNVKMLVLASGGSGQLVSYFSGKGIDKINVPVLVVPGHLNDEAINAVV